ncbi:MAG: hypothetical protein GY719_34765 [bacterium]|nr:hypothetical protein [bacterium]
MAVQLDLETFERLERLLEDHALAQAMLEARDDELLELDEAKSYYWPATTQIPGSRIRKSHWLSALEPGSDAKSHWLGATIPTPAPISRRSRVSSVAERLRRRTEPFPRPRAESPAVWSIPSWPERNSPRSVAFEDADGRFAIVGGCLGQPESLCLPHQAPGSAGLDTSANRA